MNDNIKNKVDSIDKSKLNARTKEVFERLVKGLRSKDPKVSDKSEEMIDKIIANAKAKNSDIFIEAKTSKANKEDSNAKVKSRRQQLFDAIQNDPKLSGFNKFQSIIEIDAERVALPKGKRVSKKGWKNQYGKSTGGRTYYETRENRMDRVAPISRSSTPKPWLKYGGEIEEGKYAIVVEDKNGNEKLANTKNSMDEAMAYATLKKNVIGRNGIVKVYNDEKECVYKSFYKDGGYMAEGGSKVPQKVKDILANKGKMADGGNLPIEGEVIDIKDIDYDMMSYLFRTNKILIITMKNGEKIKSSVGLLYGNLIFHGNFPKEIEDSDYSIQKKSFKKVEIINGDKMSDGGYMAKGGELPNQDNLYVLMMLVKGSLFGTLVNGEVYSKKEADLTKQYYEKKDGDKWDIKIFTVKEILERETLDEHSKNNILRNYESKKEVINYRIKLDKEYGFEPNWQEYEHGGEMDDEEGVDLFEDYEDQPEEVSAILSKYEQEDNNYDTLNDLLAELNQIGYTFEFGLDAEPYDLRKIGQTGKSEYYAEGGELGTINTELINVKNNIMGTTTLQMKIKGMRKPQDFIVYPISADQSNKPIMIQSDTRFGFLDLSTGEGLMSQSHANGAYSYHYQTDKKVHFKLSETDVQRIKSDLSKKASSKVGNSVVFSDNSGANMMAKGGEVAKVGEPYDSMTKYRLEAELNKLMVKRDLLKRKYGDFESEDIIENGKERDKIITLLYGKNFSGVGQKYKYAKGGAIENQYESRSAEDIWDSWTKEQKMHFLDDHNDEFANVSRDEKRYVSSGNFSQIENERIAKSLRMHIRQGQYAKGGRVDESTKMVLSQNKAIAHHTEELKNALKKDPNVEPWVIGKVGRAETDISDVTHYLDGRSEYSEGGVINLVDLNNLKKGDKISITYASGINRSNKKDLMVQSKTTVNKGKPNEKDKITFVNLENPNGVKYYAYIGKSDGFIGFAIGDMAIWNVMLVDKFRDGGNIGEGRYIIYYEDPTRFRKKRKVASFDSYADAKEQLKKLQSQNEDIDYEIGNKSMFEEKMLSTTFAKGGEIQVNIGDEVKSKSGVYGIVYESTGTMFKLQDKYGNKSPKWHSSRDFKASEIKESQLKKGSDSNDNYIGRKDVRLIIIKNPNTKGKSKYLQIDKSGFLNGINEFEKGGSLISKGYRYIKRADINQAVYYDKNRGSEVIYNPKNGFWVSKDALVKAGMNEMEVPKPTNPNIMSFEDFKKKTPDVYDVFWGDKGVVYKAKYDQYSDRFKYFKNGRRNSKDKETIERTYQQYVYFMEQGKDITKPTNKLEEGGHIGFEGLADKVAKKYEGMKVPSKYQKEYGKTYSKEEAKEVGNKVAYTVHKKQGIKMAEGGETEWFDYSNANLEKLPFGLDGYFKKNANTKRLLMSTIEPTRAREKGVVNANKYMRMAYDGDMEKRKPITVKKVRGKYQVLDGNSTFANAKFSGWKFIYADIVKNETPNRKESIFEIAKKIRKDGENWQDALKRAKQM